MLNDQICFYVLFGWNWSCTDCTFSMCSMWHMKGKSSFLYRISVKWSTITVTVCLCACTGQLVQHSLTVITINSSLTQCTAGADQMFTAVCAISCQLSTVHTVTHSAISKQQTYPTLNTLYHYQQQLCTTFICTEEHWKVILTVCFLQSSDSQHSHCYCWPTDILTAVHCTNSTIFVSPLHEFKLFVLLLYGTLRYQQNFCFN